MQTSIIITGEFDPSVPIIPVDPAIGSDTLCLFDILDPATWPTQAAPTAGAVLNDLADGPDAAISPGTTTWDAGLRVPSVTNGLGGHVTLPDSLKLTGAAVGFAIAITLRYLGPAAETMLRGIAAYGYAADGGWGHTQWAINHGSSGEIQARFAGTGAYLRNPAVTFSGPGPWHIALTAEKNGGTWTTRLWVNGVVVDTKTTTGALPIADVLGEPRLGMVQGVSPNQLGASYMRVHASNLAGRSGADFVAADRAARQEWWA